MVLAECLCLILRLFFRRLNVDRFGLRAFAPQHAQLVLRPIGGFDRRSQPPSAAAASFRFLSPTSPSVSDSFQSTAASSRRQPCCVPTRRPSPASSPPAARRPSRPLDPAEPQQSGDQSAPSGAWPRPFSSRRRAVFQLRAFGAPGKAYPAAHGLRDNPACSNRADSPGAEPAGSSAIYSSRPRVSGCPCLWAYPALT